MMTEFPLALKSPLRYPGGKTRATKTLFKYFPKIDIEEYREPFLGGGGMAIEFTRRFPHVPVTVSDYDFSVYAFWKTLQDDYKLMTEHLLEAKAEAKDVEGHRTLHENARAVLSDETSSTYDIGVAFFIANKCGFSGLMSGGFSAQASKSNFSENNIRKLPYYGEHIKEWYITCEDANNMLSDDPHTFVYLDPPYAKVGKDGNSFIYGRDGDMHKSFDHDRFCASIHKHTSPMLISYDNNELIKKMYPEFHQETFNHTYTFHSGEAYRNMEASRKELVMWNYDIRN